MKSLLTKAESNLKPGALDGALARHYRSSIVGNRSARSARTRLWLLLPVLLLLVACSVPGGTTGAPSGPAGVPADPASYPGGSILTTVAWVAGHLSDPNLRLIDVSSLADYRTGHIPGAVHVWWQDTIEVNNDVYGMLTGADGRARIIRDAGITPASTVVVYDASGGRYAARVLWLLNAVGFNRVMLLDGGRQAWLAGGHGLTQQAASPPPGGIDQRLDYGVLISNTELRQHLTDGSVTIVDNRTPAEEQQTWFGRLRVGRIPGAIDVPWTAVVQSGSIPYYADPAALARAFAPARLDPNRTVVVYGLDGVDAAQTYVALKLLGYRSVRLYDGSWAQWGSSADYPAAPLASAGDPA